NVGGTAQIVNFALHGVAEPYAPRRNSLEAADPGGLVYHITATSPNLTTTSLPPGTVTQLPADGQERNRRRTVLRRVGELGHDWHTLRSKVLASFERNLEYLLPASSCSQLPPDVATVRSSYGVADTLAQYFLARTRSAHHVLLIFVGAALVLFEVFVHFEAWA